MKKILAIIFICLTCSYYAQAQDHDTVQPDSVYRNNHVRLRERIEEDAVTKAKEIFVFNPAGQYWGFILTDNETGHNPQLAIWYTYNSQQVLTAEADTSFYGPRAGTIKRSVCSYDNQGRLATKTLFNKTDTVSIITYYPAERKQTEKLYRAGAVYRQQSTYYDEHGKSIRFTGNEIADPNAKPKTFRVNLKQVTVAPPTANTTWDYVFKNTYDSNNRLIHKQRSENKEVKDDTDYLYNKAGLLTEIHTTRFGSVQVIKFRYTYYK
jgi:hypothetical protein